MTVPNYEVAVELLRQHEEDHGHVDKPAVAAVYATLAVVDAMEALSAPEGRGEPLETVWGLARLLPNEFAWETIAVYADKTEAMTEADTLNRAAQGVKWTVNPLHIRY